MATTPSGKILDALKEAGVEDNTHRHFLQRQRPRMDRRSQVHDGKASGAKGYDTYYSVGQTGGLRGRKRSLFEGGVRVPFIVRWPGHTPAGAKNDTTVFTAVDLLPTLCAAAGVDLAGRLPGRRRKPARRIQGRKHEPHSTPIFWEWRPGKKASPIGGRDFAVREGDWKLAMNRDASRVELYNPAKTAPSPRILPNPILKSSPASPRCSGMEGHASRETGSRLHRCGRARQAARRERAKALRMPLDRLPNKTRAISWNLHFVYRRPRLILVDCVQ